MFKICLTEANEIFVWGSNGSGILGHKGKEDVVLPKKLESLEGKEITKVGAGYNFSIALSKVSYSSNKQEQEIFC